MHHGSISPMGSNVSGIPIMTAVSVSVLVPSPPVILPSPAVILPSPSPVIILRVAVIMLVKPSTAVTVTSTVPPIIVPRGWRRGWASIKPATAAPALVVPLPVHIHRAHRHSAVHSRVHVTHATTVHVHSVHELLLVAPLEQ